jgi:creatinine deaminase
MDRTQDWGQDRDEFRLHGSVDGHDDPTGHPHHPHHVQEQARAMLATAVAEARAGLAEGGIPVGAALYGPDGALLGRGRNRRVQDDGSPPSPPAGTAAAWCASSGSPGW